MIYQAMYPHFWHPTKAIITTACQYMVVAISVERYVVICHNVLTSPGQIFYTFCVGIFSVIVNLPRFFEFKTFAPPTNTQNGQVSQNHNNVSEIETENGLDVKDQLFSLSYQTSALGENPDWVHFMAYHEISLILFCLIVIAYCNFQVWHQVLASSRVSKHR